VFLTVPDGAIAGVCQSLAWQQQSVVHCSGAAELSVLKGAPRAGGFHPLVMFADPEVAARAIAGAAIGAVVGIFLGLIGILIGPFIGAMIGELSARRDIGQATRAGSGAAIGLALAVAGKLALGFAMIGVYLVVRFF